MYEVWWAMFFSESTYRVEEIQSDNINKLMYWIKCSHIILKNRAFLQSVGLSMNDLLDDNRDYRIFYKEFLLVANHSYKGLIKRWREKKQKNEKQKKCFLWWVLFCEQCKSSEFYITNVDVSVFVLPLTFTLSPGNWQF